MSGGGFRATLFHLGAVWRLNELSQLPGIGRISSVSGGSILSGLMAVRWPRLEFNHGVATNFREEIVEPIWRFCSLTVDTWTAIAACLPSLNLLPLYYQRYLVGKQTLQDIADRPEFVFNATHLETGRNWIFSKSVMRTYRLGIIDRPNTRLSQVMAASSALPPVFSPVVLNLNPNAFRRSELADLFDRVDLKKRVSLSDGGIYDNLGVHSIRDCGTVLVSDASAPLDPPGRWSVLRGLANRSKRPIDIAMEQTKALRRHAIVTRLASGKQSGALWTIGTPITKYPLQSTFVVDDLWRSRLQSTRTRLNSFSDEEKGRIINWGYLQCDLSVRSYFLTQATPPQRLPFPQFQFLMSSGQ